jgi:DNA anti-recombination protein RmuC
MPVTAKFSKQLYDRLGDEVANELVDFFKQADTTYQTELRTLNELNFARFDSKLEQRVTQLDAKIDRVAGRLDAKIDDVETRLNAKIDGVETRLDAKIDGVETRLDAKIDGVETRLDAKIGRVAAELKEVLERRLGDQTRWLFVAWATLLIPIIGLWARK